jgi:hypothetical protein
MYTDRHTQTYTDKRYTHDKGKGGTKECRRRETQIWKGRKDGRKDGRKEGRTDGRKEGRKVPELFVLAAWSCKRSGLNGASLLKSCRERVQRKSANKNYENEYE